MKFFDRANARLGYFTCTYVELGFINQHLVVTSQTALIIHRSRASNIFKDIREQGQ